MNSELIHHVERNDLGFQRVAALDRCFAILDLIAGSRQALGVSQISRRLHLKRTTVFNLVRTLADLEVLERRPDSKLVVGTRLYVLFGKAAGSKGELVRAVHPYLKAISFESRLSSFLAIRGGMYAVIVDKVEAAADVRATYDIGIRLPLLIGAAGKALLSQLSDAELDTILDANELPRLTPNAGEDKASLRDAVIGAREEGIVADTGAHVNGVTTLAVPISTRRTDLQAAIVVVGLKWHWRGDRISSVSKLLKEIAAELDGRFSNSMKEDAMEERQRKVNVF